MEVEKIWKDSEWTDEARQIIDGLKQFPDESKLFLILRHSHRNEPTAIDQGHKLRLTPQGHEIAKKFGENLPKSRLIKIFHSIIWRCEETAREIHEGFKNIGGESEVIGNLNPLMSVGINEREFYMKVFNKGSVLDSFHRWVVNYYDPKDWTPFFEYCKSTAQLFLEQAKDFATKNGLYIFVTHDLNLLALRYGWFGLPIKKWVKFLGGFAFTINLEQPLLFDYGMLTQVAFPYWWDQLSLE